jgi:DNA-binding YbaB/EbfC family protein
MQRMMRQFQKIQAEMMRVQEEVGQRTVEASAGGGAVVATANGKGELTRLAISPEAIDPSDPEMLGDLVLTACNEALRRAREMMAREIQKVAGLPGGVPGLPGL